MPMLYGEGQQAFVRLQEEIIKITDDHTIFAWRAKGSAGIHGLLADSPHAFADSSECSSLRTYYTKAAPFAMTNMGLHIELPLLPVQPVGLGAQASEPTFDAVLSCTMRLTPDRLVAIRVRALPGFVNRWTRIECDTLHYTDTVSWPCELYIPQTIPERSESSVSSVYQIVRLRSFALDNPGLSGTFWHYHVLRVVLENVPKIESSGTFTQFDHRDLPARTPLYPELQHSLGHRKRHSEQQFCVVGAARGRAYGWFVLQRVSNATELIIIVGRHMTGQLGFGVLWSVHRRSDDILQEESLCPLQPAGSWIDVEVYCDSDEGPFSWSNVEKRVAVNRVRRVPLRRAKVDVSSEPGGRFFNVDVQMA